MDVNSQVSIFIAGFVNLRQLLPYTEVTLDMATSDDTTVESDRPDNAAPETPVQRLDSAPNTPQPPPSQTTTEAPTRMRVLSQDATLVGRVPQPDDTFIESAEGRWLKYFAATDVGLVREHNEDAFCIFQVGGDHWVSSDSRPNATVAKAHPEGTVFSVFDGMGGAAAGEVASALAAKSVHQFFEAHKPPPFAKDGSDIFVRTLVEGIHQAGKAILRAAEDDHNLYGMGTTATVVGLYGQHLYVGQVGDSRAYVLRQGSLTPLTKDQSLVNQLLEAGQLSQDEVAGFEHSNIVLQALGTSDAVFVEVSYIQVRRGDRLLVCSDGLSSLLHDDIIRESLGNFKTLKDAWEQLRLMTHSAGAHDNLTAIIVDFFGSEFDLPADDDPACYHIYTKDIAPLNKREDTQDFRLERVGSENRRDESPFSWSPPANQPNAPHNTPRSGHPREPLDARIKTLGVYILLSMFTISAFLWWLSKNYK